MNSRVTSVTSIWSVAVAVVAAYVFLGFVYFVVWSPDWLHWTRNAYPMAVEGIWTGWDAFLAIASHFFIKNSGRTIVAILALVMWIWTHALAIAKLQKKFSR